MIHHHGPWKGVNEVEYATLEWVDWFNHRRLLEPLGYVSPAEYELAYYRHKEGLGMVSDSNKTVSDKTGTIHYQCSSPYGESFV